MLDRAICLAAHNGTSMPTVFLSTFTRLHPCGGVVPRGALVQEGAHALRRERVCVPKRCRGPQDGDTPLHLAAATNQSSVVQRLLDAKAATDATNKVRGKGE